MNGSEYMKAYYRKNKEKFIARAKEWKKANQEKVLAGGASYRKRNAEKIRAYNAANRERGIERSKRYYEATKTVQLEKQRVRYEKDKKRFLARAAKWKAANRDEVRRKQMAYKRNRLLNDLVFRFVENARKRISNALKGVGAKSARTMDLLGCTGAEAVIHLEKQFRDGMSWANRKEWHVDHIRPLTSFDLTKPEQQRIAFHYSNLQPLWAKENRSKAARVECRTLIL